MVSSEWRLQADGVLLTSGGLPLTIDEARIKSAAVRFLRDDVAKTKGDQIWGLTLTINPSGKFSIEYDYNKPIGYEEMDEDVNLEKAVKRLQGWGAKVEVTDPGKNR